MNDDFLNRLIHDAEIEASMSHDDDQRECICSLDEYVNGVRDALYELREKRKLDKGN